MTLEKSIEFIKNYDWSKLTMVLECGEAGLDDAKSVQDALIAHLDKPPVIAIRQNSKVLSANRGKLLNFLITYDLNKLTKAQLIKVLYTIQIVLSEGPL